MFWCTTIICVCFSTPIETLPKHGFWTLQQHLLATKIVDHAFYSWCAEIKRSNWVPSQDCTADDSAIRRLGRYVRARTSMVNKDSSSLVSFSNFPEDFRQTNCGVPHSELTVLRCSSGTSPHDQVWRRNRRTFVLFGAHTHRSMSRHLWRSYWRLLKHHDHIFPTFLYTNRHQPIFERLSSCAIQWEQIVFTAMCSCSLLWCKR